MIRARPVTSASLLRGSALRILMQMPGRGVLRQICLTKSASVGREVADAERREGRERKMMERVMRGRRVEVEGFMVVEEKGMKMIVICELVMEMEDSFEDGEWFLKEESVRSLELED